LAKVGSPEFIASRLGDLIKVEGQDQPEVLGELLLGLVSLGHEMGLEPESALREAIIRFRSRFSKMEASALADDHPLVELSGEEIENLWAETTGKEDRGA
jgi:ATP diphosphatase